MPVDRHHIHAQYMSHACRLRPPICRSSMCNAQCASSIDINGLIEIHKPKIPPSLKPDTTSFPQWPFPFLTGLHPQTRTPASHTQPQMSDPKERLCLFVIIAKGHLCGLCTEVHILEVGPVQLWFLMENDEKRAMMRSGSMMRKVSTMSWEESIWSTSVKASSAWKFMWRWTSWSPTLPLSTVSE